MADSQSRFATLPPGQKITVIIFLIIAIFIVWEVIGMFRGNSSKGGDKIVAAPSTAATPASKQALPQPPMAGPRQNMVPGNPRQPMGMPAQPTVQNSHPAAEIAPPSPPVLLQQEQVQNKYVSALNELQMLKIQKEIAETSQAIITAKLATATAEKSISDILAEAQAASVPPNAGKGPLPSPPLSNMQQPSETEVVSYSVQSVSMEQDQWHAVVKFKDKLYDVGVGDMLPPDSSTVKAIDQSGVTLEKAGFEQRVPLTVTDNATPQSSSSSSNAPSSPPSRDATSVSGQ